ncbi:hypothetical protein LJC42_06220 [Eubacteriales bacterium OttesenSCG-928-K08]|nr:hypothetical protein [Eubacteriales bacterium OttesenSCG-928-K08]
MRLEYAKEKPMLCLRIDGIDVILHFSEIPKPNIRKEIADILTASYEARIEALLDLAN